MKQATKTQKQTTKPKGVVIKTAQHRQNNSGWSMSIYVYWFIILFFIAATFYILGARHTLTPASMEPQQQITVEGNLGSTSEEPLMKASDYYTRGKIQFMSGDLDGAIADTTTAIQTDETFVNAYILRGEAYMQMGDYRNAMNDFDSAIALDARNPIAYYDRALMNTRLEDYDSAMIDINNALASQVTNPSDVLQLRDLYAQRGQLNLWMKNWEGAIADYTNSLVHPEGIVSPTIYADRAEAYTAMGEYVKAINDYESAVRVIDEQIQGAISDEQKEDLGMHAMSYLEKAAALNLNIGNTSEAQNNLMAAYQLAVANRDEDSATRLESLLNELQ